MTEFLSDAEIRRYSRQMRLPEVGVSGQERLKEAAVLIVGAGGLGSSSALYLAAAGVGRIGLAEFDTVDESNLHRQILYAEDDIGRRKLDAATERLQTVNPYIEVIAHDGRLDSSNARDFVASYDIVLDGSDNFETRFVLNDACVLEGVPNVFASVDRFGGQASVLATSGGPCYRCLFPEPPPAGTVPSCAEAGVIGFLPGLLGTIQAGEAIKLILGIGEPLVGRLLIVDVRQMRFREIAILRDPACPICGNRPTIRTVRTPALRCDGPSQRQTMNEIPELSVEEYAALRESEQPPFLLDVRQPEEKAAFDLGGHLIPLGELPARVAELMPHRDDELIVVHCQIGGRSAQAVEFLRINGFDNVVNLKGGVKTWVEHRQRLIRQS